MSDIKVFAVTGGIGSGKSTVMEYIASLGYKTVSCDEEIKNLYRERSVKNKLAEMFPSAVKNNVIDRKKISTIVFNNKQKLNELENFIHPLVMERCFKLAKVNNERKVAFVEVPLLFESHLEHLFYGIIVVVRDKKQRIEGIKNRSNLSEQEIIERMNNQVEYDLIALDDYEVLVNDGNIEQLKKKIMEKINKMLC